MATVRLENLHKSYRAERDAVCGIHLSIADGELLTIVGPSGGGKTTVLRLVAGLESPSHGSVWIGGRDVTETPPPLRDVAMVFQNHALYPFKTVRANLEFGPQVRGVPAAQIDQRIHEAAGILNLSDLLDRKPHQLSGGEQQRVAIGRAIVRRPQVLLLDEPLSNLDAPLRIQIRREITRLHAALGLTMLYVTHDQEEAMTLGDRVAVLMDGRIEQAGTALEVYGQPATARVAGFIGSPAMNLVVLPIHGEGPQRYAAAWDERIAIGHCAGLDAAARHLILGVRPRDVCLSDAAAAKIHGRVVWVEPAGNEFLVHLEVGDAAHRAELRAVSAAPSAPATGDRVGVRWDAARVHWFRSDGRRISVA